MKEKEQKPFFFTIINYYRCYFYIDLLLEKVCFDLLNKTTFFRSDTAFLHISLPVCFRFIFAIISCSVIFDVNSFAWLKSTQKFALKFKRKKYVEKTAECWLLREKKKKAKFYMLFKCVN